MNKIVTSLEIRIRNEQRQQFIDHHCRTKPDFEGEEEFNSEWIEDPNITVFQIDDASEISFKNWAVPGIPMTALNFGSETVLPAIEFWDGTNGNGIICDEEGIPLIRMNPDNILNLIQNPEAYIADVRPALELLAKTQELLAK